MKHYVVTYTFVDTDQREDFPEKFEQALVDLELEKEQESSTYFGDTIYKPKEFVNALYEKVKDLDWKRTDEVIVYYPKLRNKKYSDIGRYPFKKSGDTGLNSLE